jgi:glycosyltransferase involved in cell wall biosynthesis
MRLSLATIVRDEAHAVGHMLASVRQYVDEFVFIDTGSSDETVDVCMAWGGRGVRVDAVPERFDFGAWKTLVSWIARGDVIVLLDADEVLTGAAHLRETAAWLLAHQRDYEAVAIPRRRWMDLAMTTQVETEAWPDWQARVYLNRVDVRWHGILHERLSGRHHRQEAPLVIEHFQDVYHLADPERAAARWAQRTALAARAGVPVEGTPTAEALARRTWRP